MKKPNPRRNGKQKASKVFAVDFDGVIHDYKNPIEGRRMGAPIEGTKNGLLDLCALGRVIIFSVWGDEKGRQTIADFMDYYDLPYDEITNIKPNADVYIDDKAIRFTNWNDVCHFVEEKRT